MDLVKVHSVSQAGAMTTELSSTARSTPHRTRHRTVTERTALYEVLDAGLIAHIGLVLDGSPVVLPTGYGRDGDTVYLHGSTGARSLRAASGGTELCLTVTHVDGIVYGRSLMHHSMNYRSAVVHGTATAVTDTEHKRHGLRVLSEHLAPGSWDYARSVSAKEFAAVQVLALPLAEASVKIRATGPGDDVEDVQADAVWAGVLPLHTTFGVPVPAADLQSDFATPPHVTDRAGQMAASLSRS